MTRENKTKEERNLDRKEREAARKEEVIMQWIPKTELGRKVKSEQIKDIQEILQKGHNILEPQIVDILLPDLEYELITVGQSKGKFGGGKRSIWRQTQKKTNEGNKPKFSTFVVVGNKDGYVGLGYGKAKETVPAREKAIRKAKLNLISIRRGNGSWEDDTVEPHTIPCVVEGKSGSVKIKLMPAPKGKGLVVQKEVKKLLNLAGIKNIYSKTYGQTKTEFNLIKATFDALKRLNAIKLTKEQITNLGVIEGKTK